jgi:dipeptidyl aminopeptidase/acylaminoacyl peptidase
MLRSPVGVSTIPEIVSGCGVPPAHPVTVTARHSARQNTRQESVRTSPTLHLIIATPCEYGQCAGGGDIMARKIVLVAVSACLIVATLGVGSARATFPGKNGRILLAQSTGIYSMNPDGTDKQTILSNPNLSPHTAQWSPDGQRIVFGAYSSADLDYNIFVIQADGTGLQQVTHGGPDPYEPSLFPTWSPDGTEIVYSHTFASEGNIELMKMDADGGNKVRLTTDPSLAADTLPVWSSDGSHIAWERQADQGRGAGDIWVMRADGSERVNITNTDAQEASPTWLPSGLGLLFVSDRTGGFQIYRVRPDGHGLKQITHDDLDYIFAMSSPDGTRVLYWIVDCPLYCTWALFSINRDGSGRIEVVPPTSLGGSADWQPVPS